MSETIRAPERAPASSTRIDGVDLGALAGRVGTPCHVYSASAIRGRIGALTAALEGLDAEVHYAVKANANLGVLALMAESGIGADIVSIGEMKCALHAGIPAEHIVFSGMGKTRTEIGAALEARIARFNVESEDELDLLQHEAAARDTLACASVRINPDVDARTHAKISTGKAENKFGVAIDTARAWFTGHAQRPNVRLDGLHMHIGSQILDIEPIREALTRMAAFWRELAAAGHEIASIDVGGGLGVCYRAGHDRPIAIEQYVGAVRDALDDFSGRILLEPGRWLVAEAGALLTRVIRIKQGRQRRFLVVDAAMTELIRPSLYDAWHDIAVIALEERALATYDVVGPVCETTDTFARARELPECRAGDLVMIKATGAYGASMASTFNARPLAAEVMVENARYAVVRRRQTFEEMIAGEQPAPHWESP